MLADKRAATTGLSSMDPVLRLEVNGTRKKTIEFHFEIRLQKVALNLAARTLGGSSTTLSTRS